MDIIRDHKNIIVIILVLAILYLLYNSTARIVFIEKWNTLTPHYKLLVVCIVFLVLYYFY